MPKKVKQGVVVSDKMDKTIVVKVASYNPHPKYKKIIETNKNYKAHEKKLKMFLMRKKKRKKNMLYCKILQC